jgi:hypothetical protein
VKLMKQIFFLILLLAALLSVGVYVYVDSYTNLPDRNKPLSALATIADSEVSVRTFTKEGVVYYEVLLPIKNKWSIPSGPPAYVYSEKGDVIDWVPDRGDAKKYVERWGEFNDGQRISLPEAARRTKQ